MKTLVALLTALAISTAPAKAEPTRLPPPQNEAAMVEIAVIAWVVVSTMYFIGDSYMAWSKYQRARGKHGDDVSLQAKCEWVPVEKK
jgi:hypothetical protein